MKKIGIVLAIVIALALIIGCASASSAVASAASAAGGLQPYTVDLSNLDYKIFNQSAKTLTNPGKGAKNTTPLGKQWDGVLFLFPETAFSVDVTQYKRITINGKYYNDKGEEIPQADGRAMVVLVYDVTGDLEGPEMGPGKNTPLKEFNLGGFSGAVSTDKGSRLTLTKAPGGILLQAANPGVKFIELTQIVLHNDTASGGAGGSPLAAVGALAGAAASVTGATPAAPAAAAPSSANANKPNFGTPTPFQVKLNTLASSLPLNIAGKQVKITFEGDAWRGQVNGSDLLAGDCTIVESANGDAVITLKQAWMYAEVKVLGKAVGSWVKTPGPEITLNYRKGPPELLSPK